VSANIGAVLKPAGSAKFPRHLSVVSGQMKVAPSRSAAFSPRPRQKNREDRLPSTGGRLVETTPNNDDAAWHRGRVWRALDAGKR
jgi:hypothetical protein